MSLAELLNDDHDKNIQAQTVAEILVLRLFDNARKLRLPVRSLLR